MPFGYASSRKFYLPYNFKHPFPSLRKTRIIQPMPKNTDPLETTQISASTPRKTRPTRAQRKRAARRKKKVIPTSAEGRSKLLENLVLRAYPSYDFFIFSTLSGVILGLAYLLDAQALLLFGILMAPLMSPLVGMMLAAVGGSAKYFFKTFSAFIVGSILVFITGTLAGFAARLWLPLTLDQAFIHSRLWWADLVALALGSILLSSSFVRSEKKPFLPSVMVAYEIFLPLSAAAFGLASGVGDIFPESIFVFVAHLAWAMLFGTLTLFFLGFRPRKFLDWIFSLLLFVLILIILAGLLLPGTNPEPTITAPQPTSTRVAEVIETQTDVPNTADLSTRTPLPVTASPKKATATRGTLGVSATPGITLTPALTATPTLTTVPTPLYAKISSSSGGGAFMRREPGGPVILTLENGELVEALTAPLKFDGIDWVQIRVERGGEIFEGWIIQSVLKTATPSPDW